MKTAAVLGFSPERTDALWRNVQDRSRKVTERWRGFKAKETGRSNNQSNGQELSPPQRCTDTQTYTCTHTNKSERRRRLTFCLRSYDPSQEPRREEVRPHKCEPVIALVEVTDTMLAELRW